MPHSTAGVDPHPEPDDTRPELDIFSAVPFKVAASLHNQLPVDEDEFSHVAAPAWSDGRSYYLCAAGDEVLKAGTAAMRWAEFLSGPDPQAPQTAKERHVDRVCSEGVADEQALWQRKLTEWLANLVCFGTTNEQEYYRLMLAAEAYAWHLGEAQDIHEYYGRNCGNAEAGVALAREHLTAALGEVDSQRCWFLQRHVFSRVPERPRGLFTSFAARLRLALRHASADERVTLGITYAGGFGRASRSVHLSIADVHPPVTADTILGNLRKVSLLCATVMLRAHGLGGLAPKGLAERVASVLATGDHAGKWLRRIHAPGYCVGDLAVTMGHLSEVLDRRVSGYGLESYRVRFLVRGPLLGMAEDWVPAYHTRALICVKRRGECVDWLLTRLAEVPGAKQALGAVAAAAPEERVQWLRDLMVRLEASGVSLASLIPPWEVVDPVG